MVCSQNKRLPDCLSPYLLPNPKSTKKEDNPLSSFLSLSLTQRKRKKKNYRNRKTGAWEVDTQILYTIHDLPTNHGIPPTGAMQFVSKGGQKKETKGKKKKGRTGVIIISS
jgi:hypothetical protein